MTAIAGAVLGVCASRGGLAFADGAIAVVAVGGTTVGGVFAAGGAVCAMVGGVVAGTDAGGAVCCAAPMAHAGSVAPATSASASKAPRDRRTGARPFMIMTSLLSSMRRLVACIPTTTSEGDGTRGAAAPDTASSDSA